MAWLDLARTGDPVSATLFTVLNRIKESERDGGYRRHLGPGPMVAGLILPPFQRGLVWDMDRMVRFVDSARRGVPLGTYTVNVTYGNREAKRTDEDGREWYFGDFWLLDGQQRLTTLERFFGDGFRVHGLLWSEVGKEEQRAFLMGAIIPSPDVYVARILLTRRQFAGKSSRSSRKRIWKWPRVNSSGRSRM